MFIRVNGKSNAFHAFQSANADFSGTGHVLYLEKKKKVSKDQESIQSSTTPVPGYQMGK